MQTAPKEEEGIYWHENNGQDKGVSHGVRNLSVSKPVEDGVHEEAHVVHPLWMLIQLWLPWCSIGIPYITL